MHACQVGIHLNCCTLQFILFICITAIHTHTHTHCCLSVWRESLKLVKSKEIYDGNLRGTSTSAWVRVYRQINCANADMQAPTRTSVRYHTNTQTRSLTESELKLNFDQNIKRFHCTHTHNSLQKHRMSDREREMRVILIANHKAIPPNPLPSPHGHTTVTAIAANC